MAEITAQMTREEFEQHHARTWDYVARVGKIWEGIAGEQQAVIDGKGYRHLGYSSWTAYWDGEFKESTGWAHGTVEMWMVARRVKVATPNPVHKVIESAPAKWADLGVIEEPERRQEFLERYEEFRPEGSRHPFREAIKEFRGERGAVEQLEEQGVVIPPYPDGPTPEQRAYDAVSRLRSVALDIQPENAARSIGHAGVARGVVQDYEFLIPWIRRFVGELKLYGEGG